MKKVLFLLVFALLFCFQACDIVDPPYLESGGNTPDTSNSVTINNINIEGLILDYYVTSATESDTSELGANWYYTTSGDTAFSSIVFTWHGLKSDSISQILTPQDSVHFDDTLAIAAGSPFGTLTFHYIADISSPGSGSATVIVIVNKANAVRKILLVDFTGQQCIYCPRGARKATELENIYGEQLIGIAIHAGSFAIPSTSGSMYTYDFRTAEGTLIAQTCSIGSYPNGAVNFKKINGSYGQQYPAWGGIVSNLLTLAPDASIEITPNFNASTRISTISVDTKFLNQLSGNYNLAVYLIEDSIMNWQKDIDASPPDNPNYIHRHAFRGSYNGAFGDLLAINPSMNNMFSKQYSLLISNTFNENHCYIVACVLNATTKEVVQAEEIHLIP